MPNAIYRRSGVGIFRDNNEKRPVLLKYGSLWGMGLFNFRYTSQPILEPVLQGCL